MALQDAPDSGNRDLDLVIPGQIPDNPLLTEMIVLSEVEDEIFYRFRGPRLEILRAGLAVDQPDLTLPLISRFPLIENRPGDAEMATSRRNVPAKLRILEDAKLPPYIASGLDAKGCFRHGFFLGD